MFADSLKNVTVFSVPLLPANACSPTDFTPAGMTMSDTPVARSALLPIVSSCEPSANVTDFSCAKVMSLLEEPNAYAPRLFTVAGTLTPAILVFDSLTAEPEKSEYVPPNALSAMAVTAYVVPSCSTVAGMTRSNVLSAPLYSTPVTVAVPSAPYAYCSSYGTPSTSLKLPAFVPA